MKSTQNLPQRLKELRNQHHYSQEELAEKLNVTRQAISRWENGKAVPDIDNILMMAELYNVPVDELFGEVCCSDDKKNPIDNTTVSPSIMEALILSIILVISANMSAIGILVSGFILIWSLHKKRSNRLIYFLCILCIGINIYEIFVYFIHINLFYGNPFAIPW